MGAAGSGGDSPGRQWTLQQSFRAFDNFVKGKKGGEEDKKNVNINVETKRILNKADSMTSDIHSATLKSKTDKKLSLLIEEDPNLDEFKEYNKDQKSDAERKFNHITSNSLAVSQKIGGAKTGKNLFNKLKKFFV